MWCRVPHQSLSVVVSDSSAFALMVITIIVTLLWAFDWQKTTLPLKLIDI
eukprot:COSAG05_NODE_2614_length_2835_cov_2.941155_3_plen_50_part_00